eukprot:CCRYP_018481-RA/>CCRYP_018481-RA protein AED:0.46 eAED:0.46 QI:0/-1/0/1/-1/1/1/0/116
MRLRRHSGWSEALRLYGNLLSAETRQPWEKIIKAQVTKAPWEDIKVHTETPTKTGLVSRECVAFYCRCSVMGEALKYYITNHAKKPNRVSIRQFLSELNSSTATSRHCPACITAEG